MNPTEPHDRTRSAPKAPPSPVLDLVGVTVDRRSGDGLARVLDDLDLSVDAGEFLVLMGPSGSGKTTLLQVAAGLLEPTTGVVLINATPIRFGDRRRWATIRRRTLGVVHQRLDLLAGLDVLDNVALPLLLDGTKVRFAHDAAHKALERLGIADLASRTPAELSVGQQQRVAVARAVVGERRVVLADEPTAAIDTVAAEGVVESLALLAESGTSVLMATHDTRLAGWADRVEYLRDGRLIGGARGGATASSPPHDRTSAHHLGIVEGGAR